MSLVSLIDIFILNEILTLFIDAVVCQVGKYILFDIVSVVRLACKSNKAFIINIDLQRIKACNQDIESHVELQTIYQKRVINVSADDQRFIERNLRYIINHEYSFALTTA